MVTLQHETTSDLTSAPRHTTHTARTTEETKPSFKTTELMVLVATVAGVLAAAALDDSLNTQWAWILVTALAVGYMLSRGLAKAGSRHLATD
jgi:hypothetical protein